MKLYIQQELNPFHHDRLEWMFRIPELKLKFYHPILYQLLRRLRDELEKNEK